MRRFEPNDFTLFSFHEGTFSCPVNLFYSELISCYQGVLWQGFLQHQHPVIGDIFTAPQFPESQCTHGKHHQHYACNSSLHSIILLSRFLKQKTPPTPFRAEKRLLTSFRTIIITYLNITFSTILKIFWHFLNFFAFFTVCISSLQHYTKKPAAIVSMYSGDIHRCTEYQIPAFPLYLSDTFPVLHQRP